MRRAAVVIAYAALTALMTWPFVNYAHFADSSYGGDARLIIWTTAWANHAVLNGLPLFDANIFFPAPGSLRYNEHLLGVSLATLPWAAAGASPVLAYNATWWLAFFLNGLAAFAWLRRFAIDAQPAFVGSLVFACSFYVMLHAHGHLHLIWLWPLPLSALLLERWFVAPTLARAAVWLAVVLMGLLTSWYIAVMVALVNAIAGAALLVIALRTASRTDEAWGRRAVHLAAAAVIAGAVVYPMARPYAGLRANQTEAAAFSADVEAYLVPPEHTLVGRWWRANVDARPRSIYGETTLFAGWIAIGLGLLGLVALVTDRRDPEACVGVSAPRGRRVPAVSRTCPAAAWGSALAPFGWLASLPGFSGMRAPARFALVCMLGLAGLAALGASWMSARAGRRGTIVLSAIVPLMLLEWFVVDFPAGKPEVHPIPAIYRTPEVRAARAIASLPEYRDRPDWFMGGDYLYYSTAHWRPIVNGFGRSEPPISPRSIAQIARLRVGPGGRGGAGRAVRDRPRGPAERGGIAGSSSGQGRPPLSARRPDRIGLPLRDRRGRLMPSRAAARRRRIRARR